MRKRRRKFEDGFKAKVALEAIKGEKTLAELSCEYGLHPNQIAKWKKKALEGLPGVFSKKQDEKQIESQKREEELFQQIGQLTMELEWLKKKYKQFSF